MAGGSFYGGLASGAMATWKMLQDEERMSMERDRQERANKVADMQIKNLEDQEAARTQVGDIARQEAGDAALASTPAAQRQANYDAAIGRNEGLVSGTQTMEGDQPAAPLTDAQKADMARAYGVGLASDDVRRYQYGLKRAQVFEAAGDIAKAKAYRDEAQDQAAAAWMQGILGKDSARVKDLYNLYPNGHTVSSVRFDEKGNVIVTDDKGTRDPMDKYDAIAQGLSVMKPETAAKFIETQLQAKDRDEIKRYLGELSNRIAQQNADTRAAVALGRSGGAPGGTRGTGAGTAAPAGKPAPEGLYGIPGVKDQKAFDDMVDPFAPKDAAPALVGPDGKTPVQVSPTDYRSAFSQNLINLATGNPDIEPGNLRAVAKAITDDGLTKGGKVTQKATLRPDGRVVLTAEVNGRNYQLGKNDLNDIEVGKFFDLSKPEEKASYERMMASRDTIRADTAQKGIERVWSNPQLHQAEINRRIKEAAAAGQEMSVQQAESEFAADLESSGQLAKSAREKSQRLGPYRDESRMAPSTKPDASKAERPGLGLTQKFGRLPYLEKHEKLGTLNDKEKRELADLRERAKNPSWWKGRAGEAYSDIRAEEEAAAAASAAARTQTGLIR